MSDRWYFVLNGKTHGPCSMALMRQRIQSGHIKPQTRVSEDGHEYKQASEFAALGFPQPQLPTAEALTNDFDQRKVLIQYAQDIRNRVGSVERSAAQIARSVRTMEWIAYITFVLAVIAGIVAFILG